MKKHGRILLTGAAGKIGTLIRPHLARTCEALCSVDIRGFEPVASNESVRVLDLSVPGALDEAMQGVSAVVHFAGHPREADWPLLLAANVAGSAYLWESACRFGVERIVYASSNHAVGFYPRAQRIDAEAPARPDSRYGVTKVFMEALARLHADKHGLKGFGIRIGHCAPVPSDARMLSHWVHPQDLCALIDVGLGADYRCEVVYGVSANSRSWWDNSRAERLGYAPKHSADAFRAVLESKIGDDPVAERYQGGAFAAAGYSAEG